MYIMTSRLRTGVSVSEPRLWQLRLFLFLQTYQSRVWDPLFRELSLSVIFLLRYGYIKNHKKTVKNEQTRTREPEEYKAEARKAKPQSKSAKKSQIPVAPDVGAAAVALLVGVLELDTHSSSEADPSESSLPRISIAA
ncbi:hypothetical protein Tco_0722905 [Tanacetum coccineum]